MLDLVTQGIVTDSKRMDFYTNATVFASKPTGGFNGTGSGLGKGSRPKVNCAQVRIERQVL